jgi:hypothetical protein
MQKVHELWFFWNYEIIFLKINLWNMSMGLWTGSGPWRSAHGSRDPSLNVGRSTSEGRTRVEREGVHFLGRRNHIGRLQFNEPMI